MTKRVLTKWILYLICLVLLYFAGNQTAKWVETLSQGKQKKGTPKAVVLIDPGHGGVDPGKVGEGDICEKNINLEIAEKLKVLLEQNDICVYMTREVDKGLYDESADSKKNQDLKRRVAMMEDIKPDVVVSIHQNSFPDASVRGAQTFYYDGSKAGKELAEAIQETLSQLPDSVKRVAKGNAEYYLLKKASCPITIVECGFITNREELRNLCDACYQEQIAWKIYMGIERYLAKR
ncbi:MAG: N-acetylmuramoyl-L-alanine amidase [Lachnospiraceae bacterium]|nr:N-acetylmuramoyl-L-alanine amidase [Lachnospiraceae bacterium]